MNLPRVAQGRDEGLRVPVAKGAWSARRSPRGTQPVVLAMLVLTEVVSMNPIRVSMLARKGCCLVIQMWRTAATSGRFRSTACRSFMR